MRTEFLRGQACLFHFHILSFRLLLLRTTPPTSWLSPSLPPSASVVLSLPCSDAFLISAAEWIPATLATLRGSAVISILIKQNRLVRDSTDQRPRLHSCVTTQRNICPKKKNTDRMHAVEAELREVNRLWQTEMEGNAISLSVKIHWCTKKAVKIVRSVNHGGIQRSGVLVLIHFAILS